MSKQQRSQLRTLGYVRNYHSDFNSKDIINHTLYHKYASSQNYYFTKEINEILARLKTPATIQFYDSQQYFSEEECLNRLYYFNEFFAKIKLLTEFYKYHHDLPRFTLNKVIIGILNWHYDKVRKLEYFKIKREIDQENQMNPDNTPKGIVGDRPAETQSTPESESSEPSSRNNNVDNILQDVKHQEINYISDREISVITKIQDEQKSEIQQMLNIFLLPPIIHSDHHGSVQPLFKKQKVSQSKKLKLDELPLSHPTKAQILHIQNIRMPLSTRQGTSSSIGRLTKTNPKEKGDEFIGCRDNLLQLFSKSPQIKRMKTDINFENKQKYSIPEIQSLELRIVQNLQEIEKNKINSNIISMDSKTLHQILSKFTQPLSSRKTKQMMISKSISSQSIQTQKSNFSQHTKLQTPKNGQKTPKSYQSNIFRKSIDIQPKMKALDLKRLILLQQDKQQTERSNKNIPKLNFNTLNSNKTSLTSRNSALIPDLASSQTLKPLTARYRINNLIEWQVKAMQKNQHRHSTRK